MRHPPPHRLKRLRHFSLAQPPHVLLRYLVLPDLLQHPLLPAPQHHRPQHLVARYHPPPRPPQPPDLDLLALDLKVDVRRDAAQLQPAAAPHPVRLLHVGQREGVVPSRQVRLDGGAESGDALRDAILAAAALEARDLLR